MHWIQDYIDLPFKELGRTREGCDCWGLVRLVYEEQLGIPLPDYLGTYEHCRDARAIGALAAVQAKMWIPIESGQERSFDVLVLRMRGVPMHTALVTSPGKMLHIHEGIGAVIEDYRRPHWRSRITGFYRHESFSNS